MESKRFRIAFSFAGEKRDFVAEVAAILARRFDEEHILYDKFHQPEFSRGDLAFYLPDAPLKSSLPCVPQDLKRLTRRSRNAKVEFVGVRGLRRR